MATSGAALDALGVVITSPDRIVFPESGLTKRALAEYYALLAPEMLLDLARRPISLVRCPQGRNNPCFFQKHNSAAFGDHVRPFAVVEADGGTADYLYVEDAAGIVACVQMGTIEFHGWGARIDAIERPDRLVFDLDPGDGVDFAAVKGAAMRVREALLARGVASLPLLTGGKGIHVVVTLEPRAEWPEVRGWAKRLALDIAATHPGVFVATADKSARRGRIFIDWLRNQRGATAVMPFSVRARPGAGVATPIGWSDLADMPAADAFSATDPAAVLAAARRRPVPVPVRLPPR